MAYREFLDGDGRSWMVWDTRPESARRVVKSLSAGWLTFRSYTELRRLIPAPVGWSETSDDQLREWLALAVPAKAWSAEGGITGPDNPAVAGDDVPLLARASDRPRSEADEVERLIQRSQRTLEKIRRGVEAVPPPDAPVPAPPDAGAK